MANPTNIASQGAAADEWTTVSYKKSKSEKKLVTQAQGRGRGRGSGHSNEPRYAKQDADSRTPASPASTSNPSSATKATSDEIPGESKAWEQKPHRGEFHGHSGGQYSKSRSKIQGSLPGWYKPPAWDVRPTRRAREGKKEVEGQRKGHREGEGEGEEQHKCREKSDPTDS